LQNLGLPEILGEEGQEYYPTILAMIANRIDSPCAKYGLRNWRRERACGTIPASIRRRVFITSLATKPWIFLNPDRSPSKTPFTKGGKSLPGFFCMTSQAHISRQKGGVGQVWLFQGSPRRQEADRGGTGDGLRRDADLRGGFRGQHERLIHRHRKNQRLKKRFIG